jgi:hypothetical protein
VTALRSVASSSPTGPAGLAARVLADLEPMLARMGAAYRSEIDEYAAMTDAQMVADVLPVSRRLVEVFLETVVHDRPLRPRELAAFEASGRDRLMSGIPLESVLHAYRIAGREAWTALCAAVQPGEEVLLASLGSRWMDTVDRTSSALARARRQPRAAA